MASPLVSRAPQCLSCIRRISSLGESLRLPAGQQIRGKKKVAKATTINVKLRSNIAGFGRKGSIVPVPAGKMRNIWFPRKMAEYQTMAQLKELGDVAIERDFTYGQSEKRIKQERNEAAEKEAQRQEAALKAAQAATGQVAELFQLATRARPEVPEVPVVAPNKQPATILARLVPSEIEFYRTAIPPPPPRKPSPSLAPSSILSAAATSAAMENATPTKTGINGSVSTADIAASLKVLLKDDVEGSRVVPSPEDISFVEQSGDRIEHLGTYTIEIKLGPSDRVRRTITVKAQS